MLTCSACCGSWPTSASMSSRWPSSSKSCGPRKTATNRPAWALEPGAQSQHHHVLIEVTVELVRGAMGELVLGADIEIGRREVHRAQPESEILVVGGASCAVLCHVVRDRIVGVPVYLDVG